jgi:PAS domain S-box-containing protein
MSSPERSRKKAARGPNAADPREPRPASATEERLAAHLFDLSPIPAVFSRLEDSTILAMNTRTSEMFGVAEGRAAGLRGSDFYVDLTQREELIDRLRRDGRADNMRIHLRTASGRTLWAQASARLVTYGGEPAVLTVFNDISDQVAAEEALKASERRLKAQSTALTELTAQYANPAGRFDDRLRTILVTSARTLQVDRLSMWRFDEPRSAIRCVSLYRCCDDRHEADAVLPRGAAPAYFAALEGERVIAAADAATDPRTREFLDTYLKPNRIGAMLDVPLRQNNVSIGVLCAEHVGGARAWTIDEQNFAVASANLISMAIADEDLREALDRLAESTGRAQLIVDTAHDAFIGVDSDGQINTWNAQAEKTFGWTAAEAVGLNLVETIIPPAFRDAHLKGMQRFHDTGEAPVLNQRLELTALHRHGREFPIEMTITAPMHTRDGFFFGAFLRDISDRRERDDQLRLAKESAEAATRAKSEFLANMSHELRTPLNGVLGYAQLLQRDRNLTPAQRESLDAISKCGSHLLDLINDILDLSKIEAGFLDIEPVTTDLAQLSIDLRYVVGESARRKGLLLSMTIAPEVPRRVVLDGRHLRQVLLNLLGNAIKFTARGEVGLRVARSEEGRLGFEVFDTGIGIESDALEEIFEAFTQTDAGAAAGGTGLGLAISHHLIRSMGDELRVESTPGRGSRFFFALPLVPAAEVATAADATDAAAAALSNARLAPGQEITALVVDDSTVNRRILAALLESAGVGVITAAGGLEAVRLAQEHRPDVIFMDLKMSDLDGLEATRRIAADPATARIPVIAVTASTLGDRRQAARDAGCADYLAKPVRAELLFAALQLHLGVHFAAAPAADAPVAALALPAGPARTGIADRLRAATAIGDVTDLQNLAQDLVGGDPEQSLLGQRIAQLVSDFDFDALRDVAATLSADTSEPAC